MDKDTQPARISFLLDSLSGGGAEQVILNLASGFAGLGYSVDVVVCKMKGALCNKIPENVNVVQLSAASSMRGILYALLADPGSLKCIAGMLLKIRKISGVFKFMPAITDYLRTRQPAGLLAALPKANINAVLARRCSGESTRIVVGVHAMYSACNTENDGLEPADGYMQALVQRYYPEADAVVAVSNSAASDISRYLGMPRKRITAIYNPIATSDIQSLSEETPDHPWFQPDSTPVILGIGRFAAEKDFTLLLKAFAKVRARQSVRLVLLGGDESSAKQCRQKRELIEQAKQLGIQDDFDMPGFVDNPFSYLGRASVFVLSSRCEGFGNVLVEALLCGCPVVSTNCPGGPAEILENGKYGVLVPVGDECGLAEAICKTLNTPPDKEFLRARGGEFSIEKAVEGYRRLIFGKSSRSC